MKTMKEIAIKCSTKPRKSEVYRKLSLLTEPKATDHVDGSDAESARSSVNQTRDED